MSYIHAVFKQFLLAAENADTWNFNELERRDFDATLKYAKSFTKPLTTAEQSLWLSDVRESSIADQCDILNDDTDERDSVAERLVDAYTAEEMREDITLFREMMADYESEVVNG